MKTETKGRGRPATGTTTVMVRIPGALKPAVMELVKAYRQQTKGKAKRPEFSSVAPLAAPPIDIVENQKQLTNITS